MITNEILNEKYRVQRRLSASCKNIHDYFEKSHKSASSLLQKRGIQLKYTRLPNKTVQSHTVPPSVIPPSSDTV